MKVEAEVDEKEILMRQLKELNSIVKRCGAENRLSPTQAATLIQSFFRGRRIRTILKPYFQL